MLLVLLANVAPTSSPRRTGRTALPDSSTLAGSVTMTIRVSLHFAGGTGSALHPKAHPKLPWKSQRRLRWWQSAI
jgi:hypothetical protein